MLSPADHISHIMLICHRLAEESIVTTASKLYTNFTSTLYTLLYSWYNHNICLVGTSQVLQPDSDIDHISYASPWVPVWF